MKTFISSVIMVAIFAMSLFSNAAMAADQSGSTSGSKCSLLSFRINEFAAFQSGGNSFSGEVSWNPLYKLNDSMGIRGNFGASLLHLAGGAGNFAVLEYEALFSYDLNPTWNIELGGGAQTWFVNPSTTNAMASGNVGYKFNEKFLNFVDRIFVGYSAVFITNAMVSEIKAGVQLSF